MQPKEIAIDRNAGLLQIAWPDGHRSEFALRWMRANCPCATCREARRAAVLNPHLLRLTPGPPPSTQIADAELVGNYAIRLRWTDGHDTGIFPFASLRTSCPCPLCNPDGPPSLLPNV